MHLPECRDAALAYLLLSPIIVPIVLLHYSTPCPGDPEGCWSQAFFWVFGVPLAFLYHALLLGAIYTRRHAYMIDVRRQERTINGIRISTTGWSNYYHHSVRSIGKWFSAILMVYYVIFISWAISLRFHFENVNNFWPDTISSILWWILFVLAVSLLLLTCYEPHEIDGEYEQLWLFSIWDFKRLRIVGRGFFRF